MLALLFVPAPAPIGSVAAQSVLPPAPPPGGPVQGPPDGAIAPGPPVRVPTPVPAPAPAPAPTPAPSPPPAPPPGEGVTPAPAPPREQRRPVEARQPEAGQRDRTTPAGPPPAAPAAPDDAATSSDAPAPAPVREAATDRPAPAPDPVPDVVSSEDGASNWPGWWPFALVGGLILIGAGWWAARRRKPASSQGEAVAPDPADAPVRDRVPAADPVPPPAAPPRPAPPPPPPPPSAPRYTPPLAHLECAVEPVAASTTLVNLRLRYALVLRNLTDAAVEVTGLADTVLAGSGAQEAAIRQWHAAAPLAADAHWSVPGGGELRIERELAVPLAQLTAMRVGNRTVMIPVLLFALSYRHATGLGRLARAHVLGKPGTGGRLAPLQLDQGMGGFGVLAARDTGIASND